MKHKLAFFTSTRSDMTILEPLLNEINKSKISPQLVKKKIGRNEPCFCGSGKKYKHCCGSL